MNSIWAYLELLLRFCWRRRPCGTACPWQRHHSPCTARTFPSVWHSWWVVCEWRMLQQVIVVILVVCCHVPTWLVNMIGVDQVVHADIRDTKCCRRCVCVKITQWNTGGIQGEYRGNTGGIQGEYRGNTGGIQGEYRGNMCRYIICACT